MNNIINIFLDDASRIFKSIISIMITLSLLLAPAFVVAFASAGSAPRESAANASKIYLVNKDNGYKSDLVSVNINIANKVINSLLKNDKYDWELIDEKLMDESFSDSRCYAVMMFPEEFSSQIMAAFSSQGSKTRVEYVINEKYHPSVLLEKDASNPAGLYNVQDIVEESIEGVAFEVAQDIFAFSKSDKGQEYLSRLVVRLGNAIKELEDASNQVRFASYVIESISTLSAAANKSIINSSKISDLSNSLLSKSQDTFNGALESARSAATSIDYLQRNSDSSTRSTSSTSSRSSSMSSSSSSSSSGSSDASQTVAYEEAKSLTDGLSDLTGVLSRASREAIAINSILQDPFSRLSGVEYSITTDITNAKNSLGAASNRLKASASKIKKFQDDIVSAISRGKIELAALLVADTNSGLIQWLMNPIKVEKKPLFLAHSYTQGISPYMIVVGIWFGSLLLIVLLRIYLSKNEIEEYEYYSDRPLSRLEEYFGRYLIIGILSLLQSALITALAILFVEIPVANIALLFAFTALISLCASSFIYAFVAAGAETGLVVVAGFFFAQCLTFVTPIPVQMLHGAIGIIEQFLPFAPALSLLNQSIAGPLYNAVILDIAILVGYFALSLLLGYFARNALYKRVVKGKIDKKDTLLS